MAASDMLDKDTMPYHKEGRGGTPEGGSWPYGKPGTPEPAPAPSADELLAILREVAEAPRTYRGLKTYGETLPVRYTAVELSDPLMRRINSALTPAPSNLTEREEDTPYPGKTVRRIYGTEAGTYGVLRRKAVTPGMWFVDIDGPEHIVLWPRSTFVVVK